MDKRSAGPEPSHRPQSPQTGRAFRGRFMDIVHPSSDVQITDKLNHASDYSPPFAPQQNEQIKKEPASPLKKDFADDISSVFEPMNTPESAPINDEFKSPFLPDTKVEKRPLGAPANDTKKLPEWLKEFHQLELPADDGAKGELESQLLAENPPPTEPENSQPENMAENVPDEPLKIESKKPNEDPLDMRAALENTMIHPQYKVSENAQMMHPNSPYANSAVGTNGSREKKSIPAWLWILIMALLMVAGSAAGALIYFSGWLG